MDRLAILFAFAVMVLGGLFGVALHEALQERGLLPATKVQRSQSHSHSLIWDLTVTAIVLALAAWFLR